MAWIVGVYVRPYSDTVVWTVVFFSESEKRRSIVHRVLSFFAVHLRTPEPVFKGNIWHAQHKT